MQGIQLYQYKLLQESLKRLKTEPGYFNEQCPTLDTIKQHEEKLNNIYMEYQASLENLSGIIKQFDQHKQSIRRVISLHKKCRKNSGKKSTALSGFREKAETASVRIA